MRRYLIHRIDFDSRATLLNVEIMDDWNEEVKENWRQNQRMIKEWLAAEFGPQQFESKLANLKSIGGFPFSIVDFHNRFLRQIRNAYVLGSYYPALCGTCALGERILNHLVLRLREYYKNTAQYRKVYRKDSFDDWAQAINVLESWNVLRAEVTIEYRKLHAIRNSSIHFNQSLQTNDKEISLDAIQTIQKIIDNQFGVSWDLPWAMKDTPGWTFISKNYEGNPFVKEFYLPSCIRVSPYFHFTDAIHGSVPLLEDIPAPTGDVREPEVDDAEFVRLAKQAAENKHRKS